MIPPFRVVADPKDFVKLYTVVSVMILMGLGILGAITARIRVHQVIKLGEE